MVLTLGEIMRLAHDEEMEERLVGRSREAGKRKKNWREDIDKIKEKNEEVKPPYPFIDDELYED